MHQHASTYSVVTSSLDPRVGVEGQTFFMNVVMLHIKLIGMEHRAPFNHIFCPNKHPRPLGWGQTIKIIFVLKVPCHVAYQIKGH